MRRYPTTLTIRLAQKTKDELVRIAGEGPHARGEFVRRLLDNALFGSIARREPERAAE
jgi:hypothetical protein